MKFLCVPCDAQMNLAETKADPDTQALSVIFRCSKCGSETAMLTNAAETQMVSSLGVKIGSEESSGEEPASKCPFSGAVRDAMSQSTAVTAEQPKAGPQWTPRAEFRLNSIPEFVRPMAKIGIEQFAAEKGYTEIDEDVLDEARASYGFS